MEIRLMKNYSENIKIGKTLSTVTVLTGTLREQTNVINPEILLEIESPVSCNYAFIPEFNRYYFVKEFESVREGLWRVKLSVDVLESFKTEILQMTGIVDKQADANVSNLYLNDGSYVLDSRTYNTILNYSGGFNDGGEFILIVSGA